MTQPYTQLEDIANHWDPPRRDIIWTELGRIANSIRRDEACITWSDQERYDL